MAEPIADGTTGTGYTTIDATSGPQSFDIKVIGTLKDAVVPGLDLVVFRITGPQSFLDASHGVFAGMSGSPIYDGSGDLMGAVSYSFWPTDPTIGLFTPAEQMMKLPSYPGAAARMPRTVSAPSWLVRKLGRTIDASLTDTAFHELATPFVVSGMRRELTHELKKLGLPTLRQQMRNQGLDVKLVNPGSSATARLTPTPGQLDPGVPFAAGLSSGDLSWAGIGTTTFKCANPLDTLNGAWGHEFFADGHTSFAMQSADVMFINDDPSGLFGPYMVAVPSGLYGTVTQDRLRGLLGASGNGPTPFTATADVSNLDVPANDRTGSTDIYYQKDYWGPDIAFYHVWLDELAAFDAYTGGTQYVSYMVQGTYTLPGASTPVPFTVSNTNMAYSDWSVFYAAYKLWSTLYALRYNRQNADVEFTSVDATATLTENQVVGKISHVLSASPLQPNLAERGVIKAKPGQTIQLRVVLTPVDGTTPDQQVDVSLRIPRSASKSQSIIIRGGSHRTWFSSRGVKTFDQLLRLLNGGEHPNDVVAQGFGRKVVSSCDGSDPTHCADGPFVVSGKASLGVKLV